MFMIIIKTSVNQIAERTIRNLYKDYPDYANMMGEHFEVHTSPRRSNSLSLSLSL